MFIIIITIEARATFINYGLSLIHYYWGLSLIFTLVDRASFIHYLNFWMMARASFLIITIEAQASLIIIFMIALTSFLIITFEVWASFIIILMMA